MTLRRVTVLALVVGLAALPVSWFARAMYQPPVGQSLRLYALFRDGSHLSVGSPVVIAGVRVGEIAGLSLQDGMARLDLRLQDGIVLTGQSWATKRADSLFGDSYVEIVPGGISDGVALGNGATLTTGARIGHVVEGDSTDRMLRGLARALPMVEHELARVLEQTDAARALLAEAYGDRYARFVSWLDGSHVERPLAAMATTVAGFYRSVTEAAQVMARARANQATWMEGLAMSTAALPKQVRQAQGETARAMSDLRGQFAALDGWVARLAPPLSNVATPTAQGGELARLLHSDAAWRGWRDGVAALSGLGRAIADWRTVVNLSTEFAVPQAEARVLGSVRFYSRDAFFYQIESAISGHGRAKAALHIDASGVVRRMALESRFVIGAQFGKRFGPLALRAGIKEGGFALGTDFWTHRVRLAADVMGDSFARAPRLKLAGAVRVWEPLFVQAGLNDAINTPGYLNIPETNDQGLVRGLRTVHYGRDYYVGTALEWSDAELMSMLKWYGAALVAMF